MASRKKILFCLFCLFLVGCRERPFYRQTQALMGTFVEVASPDNRALHIAFSEIKRIEGLLSKYDPGSEISRLNNSGRLTLSPETLFILKKSAEFWEKSGGAFDVTVGPLADLWGFSEKEYSLPKEEEVRGALRRVGFEKIDFQGNQVSFKAAGMKLDLGAIAKGYAVDCAVKKIRSAGIKSCLIAAGGNIYCLGDKYGKPWRVAVRDPRRPGVIKHLALKDMAVDTSGDYEQYFISGGRRYSHIFNPKTGYPAESGIISVTITAADCLTADALATAIFVLGKDRAKKLLAGFSGAEAWVITADDRISSLSPG